MKRSQGVHYFLLVVLGVAEAFALKCTVTYSSYGWGLVMILIAIVSTIKMSYNIFNTKGNSNEDEE